MCYKSCVKNILYNVSNIFVFWKLFYKPDELAKSKFLVHFFQKSFILLFSELSTSYQ